MNAYQEVINMQPVVINLEPRLRNGEAKCLSLNFNSFFLLNEFD